MPTSVYESQGFATKVWCPFMSLHVSIELWLNWLIDSINIDDVAAMESSSGFWKYGDRSGTVHQRLYVARFSVTAKLTQKSWFVLARTCGIQPFNQTWTIDAKWKNTFLIKYVTGIELWFRHSHHFFNIHLTKMMQFYAAFILGGDIFSRSPSATRTVLASLYVQRFFRNFMRYTNAKSTGTSINGPTVAANAWLLFAPNVVTATAIASSKLLLAAAKLWTEANRCLNLSRRQTYKVVRKIMLK